MLLFLCLYRFVSTAVFPSIKAFTALIRALIFLTRVLIIFLIKSIIFLIKFVIFIILFIVILTMMIIYETSAFNRFICKRPPDFSIKNRIYYFKKGRLVNEYILWNV